MWASCTHSGKDKQDTVDIEAEVADSIDMKVRDDSQLRAQVAKQEAEKIGGAGTAMRDRIDRGGKLIIFGNGGSAKDANDGSLTASSHRNTAKPILAISLSMEPANLSAIATTWAPS